MKLQRTWYIPNGCYKVADKHSIALVYWRKTGKQCTPYEAVALHGQAPYPDWHYLFQSREQMEQRISEHFVSLAPVVRQAKANQSPNGRMIRPSRRKLTPIALTAPGYGSGSR